MYTSSIAYAPPKFSGSKTIWTDSVCPLCHNGSELLSLKRPVGCHVAASTVPTVVSFVCPVESFHRSLTARLPQVPLERRTKKRNHGCSIPTQKAGETAVPVGLMVSDFASAAPCTR